MKILHYLTDTTLFEDNSCTTIKQLVEQEISLNTPFSQLIELHKGKEPYDNLVIYQGEF